MEWMARRFGWVVLLVGAACSPGPGRTPVYPDAAEPHDSGLGDARPRPDSGPPDAGVPDSSIALPDTGRPPDYPFTGVFSVLGDTNKLYAREVNGKLSIIVGTIPYSYVGTISEAGRVEVRSAVLERSGCAQATITGDYERPTAAFFLDHVTCGAGGQPLQGMMRGGFDADFDLGLSGIYELEATLFQNEQGCFTGDPGPTTVRYAIDILAGSNVMSVFTAEDVIPSTTLYAGNVNAGDLGFSTVEQLFSAPGPFDVGMTGRFTITSAIDPVRLTAQRDVFDPRGNCSFTIVVDGLRIRAL